MTLESQKVGVAAGIQAPDDAWVRRAAGRRDPRERDLVGKWKCWMRCELQLKRPFSRGFYFPSLKPKRMRLLQFLVFP